MNKTTIWIVAAIACLACGQTFADPPSPTANIQVREYSNYGGVSNVNYNLTSYTSGLSDSGNAGLASWSASVIGGSTPSVAIASSATGYTDNTNNTPQASSAGVSANYYYFFRVAYPSTTAIQVPVSFSDTIGYSSISANSAYWSGNALFWVHDGDYVKQEVSVGSPPYAPAGGDAQVGAHSGQFDVWANDWVKVWISAGGSTLGDATGQTASVSVFVDPSFSIDNTWLQSGATIEFSTVPVPEPETYAMLLAGLGLLGFLARRRTQQAA